MEEEKVEEKEEDKSDIVHIQVKNYGKTPLNEKDKKYLRKMLALDLDKLDDI
jgi:hypothetical protein